MDLITPLRTYKYDPLRRAYSWLGIIGSAVLMISGLVFVFGAFYVQAVREKQFSWFLTAFATTYALFSIFFFVTVSNLYSNVYIDREYLYVDFFFRRKQARLDDIVRLKSVPTPAHRQSFVILFRKGLTPFHRIYGWFLGRSFFPGVYVSSSIDNIEELEGLLRRYSQ
jgi:cytochrome b subunit of formate dehydrogenase